MEPGSVVQWLGILITLAAVLVALFKDEFWRHWRRPELKGSISLSPPDCNKGPIFRQPDGLSADCYYLRLWVENTGKTRAEIVQVFAAKLLRKGADGTYAEAEDFNPMNLKWSHGEEVFTSGISPGMGRHCNIGHLVNPRSKTPPRRCGRTLRSPVRNARCAAGCTSSPICQKPRSTQ
jgi:hypothetical protein